MTKKRVKHSVNVDQNETAVDPDFHKKIKVYNDTAFRLNGYVNKQSRL